MELTLRSAVTAFGLEVKSKLSNLGAKGEPEDQLRSPLERLIHDMGERCGFPRSEVVTVGESSIVELKTRPDYAVTARGLLVGHVEVKGAGPARSFTSRLESAGVLVSMDGRGRALDNVFVERLWRSLKYEEVYLKDYRSVAELVTELTSWFRFYNEERPHQSLEYQTPAEVYQEAGRGAR